MPTQHFSSGLIRRHRPQRAALVAKGKIHELFDAMFEDEKGKQA